MSPTYLFSNMFQNFCFAYVSQALWKPLQKLGITRTRVRAYKLDSGRTCGKRTRSQCSLEPSIMSCRKKICPGLPRQKLDGLVYRVINICPTESDHEESKHKEDECSKYTVPFSPHHSNENLDPECKPRKIKKRMCDIYSKAYGLFSNCLNNEGDNAICDHSRAEKIWSQIPAIRKLMFYWQALNNDCLSKDPLENFVKFYAKSKSVGLCEIRRVAVNMWNNLSYSQKLPFIVESFIAESIDSPEVFEEDNIRNFFNYNRRRYFRSC